MLDLFEVLDESIDTKTIDDFQPYVRGGTNKINRGIGMAHFKIRSHHSIGNIRK